MPRKRATAHFVYVVRCADGTLYTGYAKNVAARIEQHNAGKGAKYTASRRPVELVYRERKRSLGDALRREYQIKSCTRDEKEQLIRRRRRVSAALCLVALLLVPGAAHAQQKFATARGTDLLLLPAVQYGSPLKVSGGATLFIPTAETSAFRRRGYVVDGAVGQGGVRGGAGYASYLESLWLDARGVVQRTFSSPREASGDSTYVGGEAGVAIGYVRVSAGVGQRIGGSGEHGTIFTWTASAHWPITIRR